MPLRSSGSVITNRILLGTRRLLDLKGLDSQEQLARVGIDPSAMNDPDGFVDFDAVSALLENAATDAKDPAFGLHLAELDTHRVAGLLQYFMASAPDLRHAMKARVRYMKLLFSGLTPAFTEDKNGGRCEWQGELAGPTRHQFMEFAVGLLVDRIRALLKEPDWHPLRVTFKAPALADEREYLRLLGPCVEFNAPKTCLFLDKASLDRQLPSADAVLFSELQNVAQKLPAIPTAVTSTADKVMRRIAALQPHGDDTLVRVAADLGLSTRTLQRDLAASSTSFEAVRDEVRKQAGHRYLTTTDLPLTEIAFLLGYSDLSGFSRAARIWYGEPASNIRKRERKES